MKYLGLSGFHAAMSFKKAYWPGLDEREYRIAQGHDSAACLVVDGEIVAAAAEERFSRKKHTGDFPIGAINYCLKEAGIELADVDEIAHGFDYTPYEALFSLDSISNQLFHEVYSREKLVTLIRSNLGDYPEKRIVQVGHHLAHAASAYYTSGWDQCLVVVIDGMGEANSATV